MCKCTVASSVDALRWSAATRHEVTSPHCMRQPLLASVNASSSCFTHGDVVLHTSRRRQRGAAHFSPLAIVMVTWCTFGVASGETWHKVTAQFQDAMQQVGQSTLSCFNLLTPDERICLKTKHLQHVSLQLPIFLHVGGVVKLGDPSALYWYFVPPFEGKRKNTPTPFCQLRRMEGSMPCYRLPTIP